MNKAGCTGGVADADGERLEVEWLRLGSRVAYGTGGEQLGSVWLRHWSSMKMALEARRA